MKKNALFFIIIVVLSACQNKGLEMTEYENSNKTLTFNIPSYMHKTDEDNSSMRFEGNKKFVNIMWNKLENSWDIERFSQHLTENTEGLTLVEKNDTLIVYEIQKGMVTLPALIFSLHERSNYSILVTTMGIGKSNHQIITNSIH